MFRLEGNGERTPDAAVEIRHGGSCSGHPRPGSWMLLSTAGLLAHRYLPVACLPANPEGSQWRGAFISAGWRSAIRLQLRGQPRSWSLLGLPHRVPY